MKFLIIPTLWLSPVEFERSTIAPFISYPPTIGGGGLETVVECLLRLETVRVAGFGGAERVRASRALYRTRGCSLSGLE